MIKIVINQDGKPSESKVVLGNKYENNDEYIQFEVPSEYENYNKYVIAVIKKDDETITTILPVVDNILTVSTQLTHLSGGWSMYLMCRQQELDLTQEDVNISANANEHVFISDGFIGIVNGSLINKELVDNALLDTNLKTFYDDILNRIKQLENDTNNSDNITVDTTKDWNVNDENDPRYIHNRPIHIAPHREVLYDGMTSAVLDELDGIYIYTLENGDVIELIEGVTYRFVIDTEYSFETVATTLSFGGNVFEGIIGLPFTEYNGEKMWFVGNMEGFSQILIPPSIPHKEQHSILLDVFCEGSIVDDKYLPAFQADWEEADETSPAYIWNKPIIEAVMQSDWNVNDVNDIRYIKNKPNIINPVKPDWEEINPNSLAYIRNKPFQDFIGHRKEFTSQITSPPEYGNWYFSASTEPLGIINDVVYKVTISHETNQFVEYIYSQDSALTLMNEPPASKYDYDIHISDDSFVLNNERACQLFPLNEEGFREWDYDDIITIRIEYVEQELKKIDPKFLPKTYVVDSENYRYGDECLQAILDGRQVLVKVPNKDGGTNYTNFMPVIQYQLPNENNDYLTLFYLKDDIATNLLNAMRNMSNGTPMDYIFVDVYGEITMLLTKTYKECPLKADEPFN